MRVLQLGVGSVGEVTARTVAGEPEVDKVVLADIDEERTTEIAGKLPADKVETLGLDVADRSALVRALNGVDFVINGLTPDVNMDLMDACLETGTHYMDMAAAGPRNVVGTADLDEEFALDGAFKKKDLTALVCFGIDPGASDVFARYLYDQLDTVERLTVFDGDNASADGYTFAPAFSPTTMVEECLMLPPIAFENGRRILRKPLSHSREFEFPEPIGKLKVWNVDHEESQLMPMFLAGKGLRDADFFIALDDGWVNLLLTWRNLGFDHNQEIEFEGARFRPLDLLVSRLPKSIDLIGKLHGHTCVGTLAEGTEDGKPVRRYMYQITSHDEAFKKHGVQGTGWQTGVPAACAAIMFARGLIRDRGILAPECIDPQPFLELMTQHEMPWHVIDMPTDD
ncbi:MAG: saccharopine dehydrogenase NADP-binding domain-containing protein [Deltaproteobacteria bacterium]|jgi:saccharopine dehydrogenase (NAD+, L-lysine-forming)|nr:saccharopine dehydrogenase NADP-binding domain-containing protein [Deltaproteobacteria bacterium]